MTAAAGNAVASVPVRRAVAFSPGAHIGLNGYATLLAALRVPGTPQDLAARLGFGVCRLRSVLKQLRVLELVHRVGWVRPGGHGYDLPVYRLGAGVNVPARLTRAGEAMPYADFAPAIWPKVQLLADVLGAMAHDGCSVDEIAAESAHRSTLYRLMPHLHALGLVRVAGWERRPSGAGEPRPLYLYQPGARRPDTPKPGRLPSSVRKARRRTARAARLPAWSNMLVQLRHLGAAQ